MKSKSNAPMTPKHAHAPERSDSAPARLSASFGGGRPPDVLYLGDSVLERTAREDRNPLPLGEWVRSELAGSAEVTWLSRTGWHAGVFCAAAEALEKLETRPRAVILPLNLRSLSPQWDGNPLWRHDEEIAALAGRNVRLPPAVSEAGYESMAVDCPDSPFKTVGEFHRVIKAKDDARGPAFRMKQLFIFHYLFVLGSDHPKLRSFREAIRCFTSLGAKVFAYVTPLNHEAGRKWLGPAFNRQFGENRALVEERLRPLLARGAFRDWSDLLDPSCFFSPDDATEHLNEAGRRRLARRIAEEVKKVLA